MLNVEAIDFSEEIPISETSSTDRTLLTDGMRINARDDVNDINDVNDLTVESEF
jgi:hypothetical protein